MKQFPLPLNLSENMAIDTARASRIETLLLGKDTLHRWRILTVTMQVGRLVDIREGGYNEQDGSTLIICSCSFVICAVIIKFLIG